MIRGLRRELNRLGRDLLIMIRALYPLAPFDRLVDHTMVFIGAFTIERTNGNAIHIAESRIENGVINFWDCSNEEGIP
jgi:hypothetical protein